mgnify:CR=1 FL=1
MKNGGSALLVTDLATGKPIGSAEVELIGGSQKATTSQDGLARMTLSTAPAAPKVCPIILFVDEIQTFLA